MPPVGVYWEQRTSFDGAALISERFEPRQIMLPLFFYDENGNARDKVAVLARRLLLVGRLGGELQVTQGARTRSLFEVRRTAGLEGFETPIGNWRRLVLELTAGDPWWYGPTQQIDLAFDAETPFDEATVDFDDAGTPLDGGNSTLFTVSSDIDVFPEFVVTGPFTDLSVSNSLTGESWQIDQPVAAGQVLVVDARPGRRGPRMQGAVRPDWSLVTAPSRLFTLRPGSNTIAVGAAGDDPDSNVQLRYRARFATP
jgi:hypothetical protein